MKNEIWKDIKGYESYYQVSNLGRIKSKERYSSCCYGKQRLLKEKNIVPTPDKNGYLRIMLSKDKDKKRFYIHELVAQAFLDNSNNHPCVNHIDSNRTNNEVENLEFCTHKQNIEHAYKNHRFDNMRKIKSEIMKRNKLNGYIYANEITKKRVGKFDEFGCIEIYESISEASRKNNISITSISYSANGKRKTGGGYLWHFV